MSANNLSIAKFAGERLPKNSKNSKNSQSNQPLITNLYQNVYRAFFASVFAIVFSAIMLSPGNSDAQESQSLSQSHSSTRQFDLQFQQLVKNLTKSIVAVQVASRTSPFTTSMTREATVGSAPPIYLRNVSALAVDSGGYLICAAALLSNQDSLWIIRNGIRYPVSRLGIDFRSGLALLKTSAPDLIPVTYVQKPSPGGALTLFLKAVGSESVEPTLSIASGSSSIDGYLEFSGPVGSGTVGGAFFNMDGHLLGLALGSLSANGSDNRVFVLPVSRIEPIVTRLKCCGDRPAGYLGVQVANTEIRGLQIESKSSYGNSQFTSKGISNFAAERSQQESVSQESLNTQSLNAESLNNESLNTESLSNEVTNGALITVVESDSPADKSGLLIGDVVFRYDNQTVESADAFRDFVRGCAPDSIISLDLLRGNLQRRIKVQLVNAPLVGVAQSAGYLNIPTSPTTEVGDYEALLNRIQLLEERLRNLEENR